MSQPKTSQSDKLPTPLIPKLFSQPKNLIFLAMKEAKCIWNIACPLILTGFLLYSRSMISTLFLGHLGELPLAGGSLAIGFAYITGYSVLSGLAMGMEPICGQAFGAKRFKLLGPTLQRSILSLLLMSIPIAFLWFNMKTILLFCGQEEELAHEAQFYILYSLPDLIAQSFLHPLRIYLRTQSITLPLTFCATLSIVLHIPISYFLVSVFNLGIKGVALSAVWTNFNLVGSLMLYIMLSKVYEKIWGGISFECLKGWKTLLSLAIPSCVSVCLECWWYQIMILLCGLLLNPRNGVGSMGILIQTTALIYIFPSSLSFGVSTRIGNELGANNPQKAKLAALVGLFSSFFLGFSALLFTGNVSKVWARIFTKDTNIITGTARPKLGANINLGCFYLVGMPVAIWLSFYGGFDFNGLWLGLLAAQGSCVVAMLVTLVRTDWDQQAQRAQELTGMVNDGDDGNFVSNDGEEGVLRDEKSSSNGSGLLVSDNSMAGSMYIWGVEAEAGDIPSYLTRATSLIFKTMECTPSNFIKGSSCQFN